MPRQNRIKILTVFVNYLSSFLSGRTAVTQAEIQATLAYKYSGDFEAQYKAREVFFRRSSWKNFTRNVFWSIRRCDSEGYHGYGMVFVSKRALLFFASMGSIKFVLQAPRTL